MKKRMIAVLTAFALLYSGICVRLYSIAKNEIVTANGAQKKYTIVIDGIRGDILDCNGEKLVSADYENIVALKPTYKALTSLKNVLDEKEYELLRQRMQNPGALSVNIGKFAIDENSDTVMLRKSIRYTDDQLACHITGYLNGEGRGVYGIEKSFDSLLYTGKDLSVKFTADVHGRIMSGTHIEINNENFPTGEVMLTIDSNIQSIVESALDSHFVECGGAVVVEIGTGAIRAIASRPVFDARNISDSLKDERSPFLNRALSPYSVGSVFKVVVAAAAIENGLSDFSYECTGSCDVNGTVFNCNKSTAHGRLDLTKALECSCNTFFINLAKAVGADKILETASLMGFGQENVLAEGIVSKSGVIPSLDELGSEGAFANFSFGQGKFTATMLQLCNMISSVAGAGKYNKPYLVEKVTAADGTLVHSHIGGYPVYVLSQATCRKLTPMLVSVIENGNAGKAKPERGILAAGKTATAQTGIFDKNGNEICNTWFAGFFPADKPQYAVVVLKEGGSSGATDCAPIFKCIADEISALKKFS